MKHNEIILELKNGSFRTVEYPLRVKKLSHFCSLNLNDNDQNEPKAILGLKHGLFSVFFQHTTGFEQSLNDNLQEILSQ
jgi:hypothetical protein